MRVALDVLSILSALEYPVATLARITDRLDRNVYQRVNDVLAAAGGTWSRKLKGHVFAGDAAALVDSIITSGEVDTAADVGNFPTPILLAAELVELAGVRPGHTALEPSAGTGRIVDALLARGALVVAVERDQLRRGDLQLRETAESRRGRKLFAPAVDDFMDYQADPRDAPVRFDRVVMNPPFRRVGRGDHIDHVRRAFDLLAPGGVLVAVLPAGVLFRRDRRYTEFRTWCAHRGSVDALPDGSFRESGTDVSTVVARLRSPG